MRAYHSENSQNSKYKTYNYYPGKLRLYSNNPSKILQFAGAGVVHQVTGNTVTKYRHLVKDPETKNVCMITFGNEIGRVAQGDQRTSTRGTHGIFFFERETVKNITRERVVIYAQIVVDKQHHMTDPNRELIANGCNLIRCPGKLTTSMAELTKSKKNME